MGSVRSHTSWLSSVVGRAARRVRDREAMEDFLRRRFSMGGGGDESRRSGDDEGEEGYEEERDPLRAFV